jgi:hypothetical protein
VAVERGPTQRVRRPQSLDEGEVNLTEVLVREVSILAALVAVEEVEPETAAIHDTKLGAAAATPVTNRTSQSTGSVTGGHQHFVPLGSPF